MSHEGKFKKCKSSCNRYQSVTWSRHATLCYTTRGVLSASVQRPAEGQTIQKLHTKTESWGRETSSAVRSVKCRVCEVAHVGRAHSRVAGSCKSFETEADTPQAKERNKCRSSGNPSVQITAQQPAGTTKQDVRKSSFTKLPLELCRIPMIREQ